LSKDKKGFDPLVMHLTVERGFTVRRVSMQKEAFAGARGSANKTSFERLTALLKEDKVLPRKRKGLEGKVKSWFLELSAEDRSGLVARLIQEGFVSESDKGITFAMARLRGV
jgi:hypothetical protein